MTDGYRRHLEDERSEILTSNRRKAFGYARQHEMSVGEAADLEEVEQALLYSDPKVLQWIEDGDWERVNEEAQKLKAKQHRRNSI